MELKSNQPLDVKNITFFITETKTIIVGNPIQLHCFTQPFITIPYKSSFLVPGTILTNSYQQDRCN